MPELHIRARIARLLGSAPMRRLYWSLLRLLPVLRIGDRILVARHLEEALLCRAGHAYERATDWHTAHPPI